MPELNLLLSVNKPVWALLALVIFLGFFLRSRGGYVRKLYAQNKGGSAKEFSRGTTPVFFASLALLALTGALVDVTRGFATVEEELSTNRIFVAIDNSSSMYNFDSSEKPIYCADKNLREEFPRIFGACRALHRLVDETEGFARRKGITHQDQIAFLRFALYSFGQIPPTSDYERLSAVIEEMNWRLKESLGIYTEIHLALWDLYRLALERNRTKESGFTLLSFEDMTALARALVPEGKDVPFSLPHSFNKETAAPHGAAKSIIEALKEEMRDTVFIFITDANFGQLEERVDKAPVSLQKMLRLAEIIELPVYFISTDEPNEMYKRLARKTGFGPPDGKFRGDFFVASKDKGYDHIAEIMVTILQTRFGMTTPIRVVRRESYANDLALAALIFLALGVFFRETWSRSLTEV